LQKPTETDRQQNFWNRNNTIYFTLLYSSYSGKD